MREDLLFVVLLEVFLVLLFLNAVEARRLDMVAVAVTNVRAVRRRKFDERFLVDLDLVLFLAGIKNI